MPKYDYHCPSNGQVVETSHSMSQKLATWGELCQAAGVDPGDTPMNAPIERLIGMSQPMVSGKAGSASSGHVHTGSCACGARSAGDCQG
jgi:hypothetical protein